MDVFLSVLPSIISSVVGGILLALFKYGLDRSATKTKEANELKNQAVLSRIAEVKTQIETLETLSKKLDSTMSTVCADLKKVEIRMEGLATAQSFTKDGITDIRRDLERTAILIKSSSESFGKVIKK